MFMWVLVGVFIMAIGAFFVLNSIQASVRQVSHGGVVIFFIGLFIAIGSLIKFIVGLF